MPWHCFTATPLTANAGALSGASGVTMTLIRSHLFKTTLAAVLVATAGTAMAMSTSGEPAKAPAAAMGQYSCPSPCPLAHSDFIIDCQVYGRNFICVDRT